LKIIYSFEKLDRVKEGREATKKIKLIKGVIMNILLYQHNEKNYAFYDQNGKYVREATKQEVDKFLSEGK
jgi:hypothetical protein